MFTINQAKINAKEDLAKLPIALDYEKNIHDLLTKWFDKSETIKTNTSGSTGKPKTIELKKSALLKSA